MGGLRLMKAREVVCDVGIALFLDTCACHCLKGNKIIRVILY